MFTGIIEARSPVLSAEARGTGMRLVLEAPEGVWDVVGGESVAVCGVCLSVAAIEGPDGAPLEVGAPGSRLCFDLSVVLVFIEFDQHRIFGDLTVCTNRT